MPPAVESSIWKSFQWLGDMAKAASSLAVALVGIGVILWWFLGDKVELVTRSLAGTDVILMEVDKVQTEQRVQGQVLTELSQRVDELEPTPEVVQFDSLRSRAYSPCKKDSECVYVMRVRRTPFGDTCVGPPETERKFIDSSGNTHRPLRVTATKPSRLDEEWAILNGDFIVPEESSTGIGEFFLVLTHSGCGENHDQTITSESIYLQVEVIE